MSVIGTEWGDSILSNSDVFEYAQPTGRSVITQCNLFFTVANATPHEMKERGRRRIQPS